MILYFKSAFWIKSVLNLSRKWGKQRSHWNIISRWNSHFMVYFLSITHFCDIPLTFIRCGHKTVLQQNLHHLWFPHLAKIGMLIAMQYCTHIRRIFLLYGLRKYWCSDRHLLVWGFTVSQLIRPPNWLISTFAGKSYLPWQKEH